MLPIAFKVGKATRFPPTGASYQKIVVPAGVVVMEAAFKRGIGPPFKHWVRNPLLAGAAGAGLTRTLIALEAALEHPVNGSVTTTV